MYFNNVVLVGRLTAQPELRYTQAGKPVSNFTLAVDQDFTNAAGERGTDFFPVVVWGKLGETVAAYKDKGDLVLVEGRLQNRSWEDNEGNRRRNTEIVAESVRFLSYKPREVAEDDAFAEPKPQQVSKPSSKPAPKSATRR